MTDGVHDSPLGPLRILASGRGLARLHFEPEAAGVHREGAPVERALAMAFRQLDEYFAGTRRAFDLPLDLAGPPFQQRVWQELRRIPYGTTVSYTELARRVGATDRVRAVGGAIAATPVPVVVPCHRVVGADGSLTGYVGGLARKQALLDLEHRVASGREPEPAWALRQLALL